MFAAGIVVIGAGLSAACAILLGRGGTGEKAGKLFLLSSPFTCLIAIVGAIVLIGGALVMFVIYCAGSMYA